MYTNAMYAILLLIIVLEVDSKQYRRHILGCTYKLSFVGAGPTQPNFELTIKARYCNTKKANGHVIQFVPLEKSG